MRAVVITRPGDPGVLEVQERPTPVPGPGDLLVRVRAAGVNRADLLQRAGRYPAPASAPADIPGLEFAGEVAAVGSAVTDWAEGDRVFGITAGGAQAEFLCVHASTATAVPPELDWVTAGAVPEAYITAFDALVTQGELRAGELVLVHAAASGVGIAAVQVARAMGAIPYGTSRHAAKLEVVRPLGLEDGVALPDGLAPLAGAVARWTADRGVDVVLDLVGGPYVAASIAALGERGRLFLIGTVAGTRAEVDLRPILARRLAVRGTVLRARSLKEKIDATRQFAIHVVPLVVDGRARPVIDSVYPAEQVAEAHRRMDANETVGKVVLTF